MKRSRRSLRQRQESTATIVRVLLLIAGLAIMAGCGGSSSGGGTTTTTSPGTATASLSVTSLTFTSGVGVASAAQSVTITNTNTGTAALTISGIAFTNPVFSNNSSATTCSSSVAAGASCTISVIFTPTAAGTVTGSLTITDSASGSPQMVSLSGTGATPTVTVLPNTLTYTSQTVGTSSSPQTVTVSNTGSVPLTITSIAVTAGSSNFNQNNNCPASSSSLAANASCMISVMFTPTAAGTLTGTLTITDNASGSPQTVSLSGTGSSTASVSLSTNSLTFTTNVAVGSTSASPLSATLNNTGTVALTISSIALGGTDPSDFALVSGTNACTYSGGTLAVSASCTVYVNFTPTATGTRTAAVTITDNAGGVAGSTQSIALAGTSGISNSVPVSVNLGPNNQDGQFLNFAYVTVTVCQPGTTTCVTVPNVQVDTGSSGLRILSSALTGVNLAQINDGSGDNLNECTEYGDGSFNWGPVSLATVQIGGETASQVPAASGGTANSGIPIQIISTFAVPKAVLAANQCVASSTTPNENTVATFGANGILGVGTESEDCNSAGVNYCDNSTDVSNYGTNYWLCTAAGVCSESPVPDYYQIWNPVATFSSTDTNGVLFTLQSVPAAGAATVSGTLTFGIGTESNNAIPGGATVYERDQYGNLPEATFNGVNYYDVNSTATAYANPTFLDTGSEVYFFSDATTLTSATGVSTTTCTTGSADGLYCPASTLSLSFTVYGSNGTSGTTNLSIGNAQSLLTANPSFAAFDNLGTPGGTDPSNDDFDLGLPFFFGKTVAVGIAGATTGSPDNAYGYWAF